MSLQNRSGKRRRSVSSSAKRQLEPSKKTVWKPVRNQSGVERAAARRRTRRGRASRASPPTARSARRSRVRRTRRERDERDEARPRAARAGSRAAGARRPCAAARGASKASVPSSRRASRSRSIPSRCQGTIECRPTIARRVRSGVVMPSASSGKPGPRVLGADEPAVRRAGRGRCRRTAPASSTAMHHDRRLSSPAHHRGARETGRPLRRSTDAALRSGVFNGSDEPRRAAHGRFPERSGRRSWSTAASCSRPTSRSRSGATTRRRPRTSSCRPRSPRAPRRRSRSYARTKGWELGQIEVDATYDHKAVPRRCEIAIRVEGPVTDDQLARLEKVAASCPVQRAIEGGIDLRRANRACVRAEPRAQRLTEQSTLVFVPAVLKLDHVDLVRREVDVGRALQRRSRRRRACVLREHLALDVVSRLTTSSPGFSWITRPGLRGEAGRGRDPKQTAAVTSTVKVVLSIRASLTSRVSIRGEDRASPSAFLPDACDRVRECSTHPCRERRASTCPAHP